MITIKDIAKAANVSVASVSRVVNNSGSVSAKNRQKILNVIEQLGYRPNANARALVTRANQSVGLVIADWHGTFFSSLAQGVETIARHRNTSLLVSTGALSADTELAAIELLLEQRCKAIVVHSKFLSDEKLIQLSKEAPMVFINRRIKDLENQCVWLDNVAGGAMMARYLLSNGHRDIVILNSDQQIEDAKDRLHGALNELAKSGIKLNNSSIVCTNPNFDGGEKAIQQLIGQDIKFSAVIAYNDAVACGAMSMLQDFGINVPQQVSVIGFDDAEMAKYCRPKLTTLNYPIVTMAEVATNLALSLVDNSNQEKEQPEIFIPSLVIRQSTCRIEH